MTDFKAIELPTRLDHEGTRALHAGLTTARGHCVTVDARQTTYLGALGLQVLLAAGKQWRADGQTFALVHPTPAFCDDLKRMGAELSDIAGGHQP